MFVAEENTGELTANLKRRLQFQQNRLAEEDLPGFEAEAADFVLCQLNIFPGSGAFHWERKTGRKCHGGARNVTLATKTSAPRYRVQEMLPRRAEGKQKSWGFLSKRQRQV